MLSNKNGSSINKRAVIGVILVGVLLGSHWYAYRHGRSICEANAALQASIYQEELRATEKAIRDNAAAEAEKTYQQLKEYEVYVDNLKISLENVPTGVCRPHPDAVRVFNEALQASGLPGTVIEP
ncbi:MAG: hypothetical protein WBM86_03345 [Waterburya sp.]